MFAGPATADAIPTHTKMTARYRMVFTGLRRSVIDISDEEDESDVSKARYFGKGYFPRLVVSQSCYHLQLPDLVI